MACYKKTYIGSRNSATQNAKLLLKMPIWNIRENWSNAALFEFGLAKSVVRQLPWPRVKFKDDFLYVYHFNPLLLKALSQDGGK